LIIKFYGVRGSIPSPGPDSVKYGGNTSCVFVQMATGPNIIFDAGTGIRTLGKELVNSDSALNIILSHGHWDHIQGFPFFAPLYQPDREISILRATESGDNCQHSLYDQLDGDKFPVKADALPSRSKCISKGDFRALYERNFDLTEKPLNHPGGGSAYKIEENGLSVAYVTDNELEPPYKPHTRYDDWVEFCHGVDVLIHDAQYTDGDMPHKRGWGHSLISQVRRLAVDAEVGSLVMFHHDPDRTDSQLDKVARENEIFFRENRAAARSFCAFEGLQIGLSKRAAGGDTRYEIR
jgi:phosphoribosyl 1,2-cyclic phosphodiesterase